MKSDGTASLRPVGHDLIINRLARLNFRADTQTCAPIEMFGGMNAIAAVAFDRLMDEINQLQRRWLLTADIFQLIADMASDEQAVLRGAASVSKAVDLCEIEQKLPGHSQLRAAWSEFRDVAHLLTASAFLAHLLEQVPQTRHRF